MKITALTTTLWTFIKEFQEGKMIDKSFQRNFFAKPVWISRIIETILRHDVLPPIIVWNEDEQKQKKIMDGQQRLCGFSDFFLQVWRQSGKPAELVGLKYLPDLNGKKFSDLTDSQQARLKKFSLLIIQIDGAMNIETRNKILQDVNRDTTLRPLERLSANHWCTFMEGVETYIDKNECKDLFNARSDIYMRGRIYQWFLPQIAKWKQSSIYENKALTTLSSVKDMLDTLKDTTAYETEQYIVKIVENITKLQFIFEKDNFFPSFEFVEDRVVRSKGYDTQNAFYLLSVVDAFPRKVIIEYADMFHELLYQDILNNTYELMKGYVLKRTSARKLTYTQLNDRAEVMIQLIPRNLGKGSVFDHDLKKSVLQSCKKRYKTTYDFIFFESNYWKPGSILLDKLNIISTKKAFVKKNGSLLFDRKE